jgi:hypothetical protein
MTASLDKYVKIFRMYDETDENLAGTLKQGYMMKPELIKVCKVLAPNPEFDMQQQLKAVLEDPSYAHFFNIREGCANPLDWALKQGYVIKQGWVMHPGYQWHKNLQSQFSEYDSNSQKRKVDLLSYVSQLQHAEDPNKRKEKIATEREVNARAGLWTGYGSTMAGGQINRVQSMVKMDASTYSTHTERDLRSKNAERAKLLIDRGVKFEQQRLYQTGPRARTA